MIRKLCRELEARAIADLPCAGHRISRSIAKSYGIGFNELVSPRRDKYLVRARQEAMWLMKKYTQLSLPHIGRILGDRDHTTVIHGIKAHQARIDASGGNSDGS
jgi:chromosomal replication initiator protein